MTTKTVKTILFASLTAALIVSLSGMMMMMTADAESNENVSAKSLKQQYEEISQEYNVAQVAVQQLDNKEAEKELSIDEKIDRIQKVSMMNDLELQAAEIQRKNIESHKMPADIEKFLSDAEQKVEASVEDLTGAIINGKTRTLLVVVQTEEAAQQVRELVSYVETDETHLKVRVSTFNFSGCTAHDAECNPVMGRIQMDADNNGLCRIAVPFLDGSSKGFLTAGHCVNNSGDDVFQPTKASNNEIGDVSDGTWVVSSAQKCDCAWVSKVGTKTFNEGIFDTGYSWGYSWYAIDDHNTPAAGTFVSMGEKDGIIHSVEVLKYDTVEIAGVDWDDMMWLDEGTVIGDSGGAIFGNITHDFHGIISGGDTSITIASHWDNIETALDL